MLENSRSKTFPATINHTPQATQYGYQVLEEALRMLPMQGAGRPFLKVRLTCAERMLSREELVRKWFLRFAERYLQIAATNLPHVDWLDAISIATPLRPDRLCLSVASHAEHGAIAWWNWTLLREGFTAMNPDAAERRIAFSPVPTLWEALTTGHRLSRSESLQIQRVPMTTDALVAPPILIKTPGHLLPDHSAVLEALAKPPAPMKPPTPTLIREDLRSVQTQAAFKPAQDPAGFSPTAKTFLLPKAGKLVDGRSVQIVDWRDPLQPLGARVQSKLVCLTNVDVEEGTIHWASEHVLERFIERGPRTAHAQVRTMVFPLEVGKKTLNLYQLLWAYWTAEVPKRVIRRHQHEAQVLGETGIDGLANLRAFGWIGGHQQEVIELAQRPEQKTARDWQGNFDHNLEISDLTELEYIKRLSLQDKYTALRQIHIEVGKAFAKKHTAGELPLSDGYSLALRFSEERPWEDHEANNSRPELFTLKDELRQLVTPKQLRMMKRLALQTSGIHAPNSGALRRIVEGRMPMQLPQDDLSAPLNSRAKELFDKHSRFPEYWITNREQWHEALIQEGIRKELGLKPEEYGKISLYINVLGANEGMM
jgi:hypothetical protein